MTPPDRLDLPRGPHPPLPLWEKTRQTLAAAARSTQAWACAHCTPGRLIGALGLAGFTIGLWWLAGWHWTPLTPDRIAADLARFAPDAFPADPQRAMAQAERTLRRVRPRGAFIVIDRTHNRLYLRRGSDTLLEALVSAGSGGVLEDTAGGRKWVFDTPTGRFHIRNRRENPVWVAPDWHFIEEGEPIPHRHADRVQRGMLGEYALDLSLPGYMIHGTLYTRLLGRNASHGCIRVGRDDLRVLWRQLPIGSAVFLY